MLQKPLFLVTLIAFVAGCSASMPKFDGESIASPRLKKDTFLFVEAYALGATGCDRVEAVETSIVSVAEVIEANRAGAITKGTIKERWVATACGKNVPVIVTFTPDGAGGNYISVELEK